MYLPTTIRILLFIWLIALSASSVSANLPYHPARAFLSPNPETPFVYILSNTGQLLLLDVSSPFTTPELPVTTISPSLRFLEDDDDKGFTMAMDKGGNLIVYAGKCADGAGASELWRFISREHSDAGGHGNWSRASLSAGPSATDQSMLGSNYLASAVSFSATPGEAVPDDSLFVFGGMCPTSDASQDDWISAATYSNLVLSIDPHPSSFGTTQDDILYELGVVDSRGPPVAEAGFTVTPLQPTFSNSSSDDQNQQQNFVLVGGHTREAFINMSQVALFSLPEQSWSFLPVNRPQTSRTDLTARAVSEVEPRSGHTAVLTSDGSKIIVFGGWVGDIHTPADPQLAVLEIAEGYGGSGDWTWHIPDQGDALPQGSGVYGHGAVMLPGNVMMVYGGYDISAASTRRSTASSLRSSSKTYLFNATSSTWITNYHHPGNAGSQGADKSGPLESTAQKVGLGTGIAFGISAIATVAIVYLIYSRRLRRRRDAREKELRELALGAQRFHVDYDDGGIDGRGGRYPEMSHARNVSSAPDGDPWASAFNPAGGFGEGPGWKENGGTEAERTGLLVEIPSPTRGLRRSLHTRATYNPTPPSQRVHGPGLIHPIDEREEYEENASQSDSVNTKRPEMSERQYSDPFVDPLPASTNPMNNAPQLSPTKERELEMRGWIDDWQAAEAIMTGQGTSSRRSGSPDKSDRTSSTLSEQSARSGFSASSMQQSLGTVSRSLSQKTADLLFGPSNHDNNNNNTSPTGRGFDFRNASPDPQAMSLSASLNPNRRSQSLTFAATSGYHIQNDAFATAPSRPSIPHLESESLLSDGPSWATPPESPIKPRPRRTVTMSNSSTSVTGNLTSLLGSVRRALTSTLTSRTRSNSESPERNNNNNDDGPANSSPLKRYPEAGNDHLPRRAVSASAAIWRRKQGPADWDAESQSPTRARKGGLFGNRCTGEPGATLFEKDEHDNQDQEEEEEDWDPEKAVERRLVQVMFTVPKEKLRVVNAAESDRISVSDAGGAVEENNKDGGDEAEGKGKEAVR